jgi:hypothetical protein
MTLLGRLLRRPRKKSPIYSRSDEPYGVSLFGNHAPSYDPHRDMSPDYDSGSSSSSKKLD